MPWQQRHRARRDQRTRRSLCVDFVWPHSGQRARTQEHEMQEPRLGTFMYFSSCVLAGAFGAKSTPTRESTLTQPAENSFGSCFSASSRLCVNEIPGPTAARSLCTASTPPSEHTRVKPVRKADDSRVRARRADPRLRPAPRRESSRPGVRAPQSLPASTSRFPSCTK